MRILSIRYNAHQEALGTTTTQSDTRVDFVFTEREDLRAAYQSGWFVVNDRLLSTIRMSVAGTTVREYRLKYEFNRVPHNASVLAAVEECAREAPGSTNMVCKPPTRFFYDNKNPSFGKPAILGEARPKGNKPLRDIVVDIDGNGKDDLLMGVKNEGQDLLLKHWEILFDGQTLVDTNIDVANGASANDFQFPVVDVDGDGVDDVLQLPGYCGDVSYLTYRSGSFVERPAGFSTPCVSEADIARTYIVDADGDGFRDIVHCVGKREVSGRWSLIRLPIKEPLPYEEAREIEFSGTCEGFAITLDHDGDGQEELFMESPLDDQELLVGLRFLGAEAAAPSGQPLSVELINTNVPISRTWSNYSVVPAELNGDGLTDLISVRPGSKLSSWINTGSSTNPFLHAFEQEAGIAAIGAIVDEDGDGRDDIMVVDPTAKYWRVLRSTVSTISFAPGTFAGFAKPADFPNAPQRPDGAIRAAAMDYNGDGIHDFITTIPKESAFRGMLRMGEAGPRLVTIVDGLNKQIDVTYDRLTSSATYLHQPYQCGMHFRCTRPRHYVVAEHRVFMGPNLPGTPVRRFRHKYFGSLTGVDGRGWLGFLNRHVIEPDRGGAGVDAVEKFHYGLRSYDPAFDAYPFAGLVRLHQIETPADPIGGKTVKLHTQEHFYLETHPHPVARAYFPYASKVVEKHNELRGTQAVIHLSEVMRRRLTSASCH